VLFMDLSAPRTGCGAESPGFTAIAATPTSMSGLFDVRSAFLPARLPWHGDRCCEKHGFEGRWFSRRTATVDLSLGFISIML
jgi:hypothetical protein